MGGQGGAAGGGDISSLLGGLGGMGGLGMNLSRKTKSWVEFRILMILTRLIVHKDKTYFHFEVFALYTCLKVKIFEFVNQFIAQIFQVVPVEIVSIPCLAFIKFFLKVCLDIIWLYP